ncbi:hypothetical protein H8958_011120 [Nasalis larvatus]
MFSMRCPRIVLSGHLDVGLELKGRPGSPAVLAMEILDEFDSEVPHSETFCQQISEEDLERQADTTLERALRRLFHRLDRNPCWRRGWCNWNSVGSSLFSGCGRGAWDRLGGNCHYPDPPSPRADLRQLELWGRSVVREELNHCNSTGVLEMHERVEQLKQSIHRVHLYSRGEDQPLPVLGPAGGLSLMQPGRGLDDHLHSFGWICPPWTKFYPEQEGARAIRTWEKERRCP